MMNNIIPIAITWGLMSVIYTAIYGDPCTPSPCSAMPEP